MWRLSSPVIPALAFALSRPEVVSRSLRSGSSPSFVAESANAVLHEPCDCAEAFPLQAAKTHTERKRSRMIEACRFHSRARRLQPMPLKTTSILKASGNKTLYCWRLGDGLFFKCRVIVAHLLARVPWIDFYAPCSALSATSAMVKHRYRLFCSAAFAKRSWR